LVVPGLLHVLLSLKRVVPPAEGLIPRHSPLLNERLTGGVVSRSSNLLDSVALTEDLIVELERERVDPLRP
jgi:hypothetical protein